MHLSQSFCGHRFNGIPSKGTLIQKMTFPCYNGRHTCKTKNLVLTSLSRFVSK